MYLEDGWSDIKNRQKLCLEDKYFVYLEYLTFKCLRSFGDHSVHFRFLINLLLKNGWPLSEMDQHLALICIYLVYRGYS